MSNRDESYSDPLTRDDTRQLHGAADTRGRPVRPDERWLRSQWPRHIGEGAVIGVLGEGGAAIVFETQLPSGEQRAVKTLFPDSSPMQKRRFEREIAITAQLHHPHVAAATGHGWWNDLPYIELKKYHGVNLSARAPRCDALPAPIVAVIGACIAEALAYCHTTILHIDGRRCRGLAHRDIKPSNILIDSDGTVVVADFSIATPVSRPGSETDNSPHGSIPWFAPEILFGGPVDARCDLFSLGCVLYEMACGARAFDADSIARLMDKRKRNDFAPLDFRTRALPRELTATIHRCMARDPRLRPESMSEVVDILRRIGRAGAAGKNRARIARCIHRTDAAATRRTRRAALVATAAAGIALTAAATLHMVNSGRPFAPRRAARASKARGGPAPRLHDRPRAGAAQPIAGLHQVYDGNDLAQILGEAAEKKRYDHVLAVVTALPPRYARSAIASLYRLRALDALGLLSMRALDVSGVADAESYLLRARLLCGRERFDEAMVCIRKAVYAPALLMNRADLEERAALLKARCLRARIGGDPKPAAVISWKKVKPAHGACGSWAPQPKTDRAPRTPSGAYRRSDERRRRR